MCTYGRFTQVQRSLSYFILQDYQNKNLTIFNTADIPLLLDSSLSDKNIKIINQNISSETKLPYNNIGEVIIRTGNTNSSVPTSLNGIKQVIIRRS